MEEMSDAPPGLNCVNVEVHVIGPTCGTTEWPGCSAVQTRPSFPRNGLPKKPERILSERAVGSR